MEPIEKCNGSLQYPIVLGWICSHHFNTDLHSPNYQHVHSSWMFITEKDITPKESVKTNKMIETSQQPKKSCNKSMNQAEFTRNSPTETCPPRTCSPPWLSLQSVGPTINKPWTPNKEQKTCSKLRLTTFSIEIIMSEYDWSGEKRILSIVCLGWLSSKGWWMVVINWLRLVQNSFCEPKLKEDAPQWREKTIASEAKLRFCHGFNMLNVYFLQSPTKRWKYLGRFSRNPLSLGLPHPHHWNLGEQPGERFTTFPRSPWEPSALNHL